MFHVCVEKINVTGNLEIFLVFTIKQGLKAPNNLPRDEASKRGLVVGSCHVTLRVWRVRARQLMGQT